MMTGRGLRGLWDIIIAPWMLHREREKMLKREIIKALDDWDTERVEFLQGVMERG